MNWPTAFDNAIRERAGVDIVIANPGGMSGAGVARIAGSAGSVILKRSEGGRERHVYRAMAPRLDAAGVALPALFASTIEDGFNWLLLEDIPEPLPRERWLADPELLEMLYRLHSIPLNELPLPPDRYRPGWEQDLTRQALSLFEPDDADRLAPRLDVIREDAAKLFDPVCVISGDPNPANWGVGEDGRPVLFDWERCTLGHPAIDLAITVPGLGNKAVFATVAERYPAPVAVDDIIRAKVWVVVEFLAGCASGSVEPSFDLVGLVARIPDWIGALVRTDTWQ